LAYFGGEGFSEVQRFQEFAIGRIPLKMLHELREHHFQRNMFYWTKTRIADNA